MSIESTSNFVAVGWRALVTLGRKRRPKPVPFVAAMAGLALVMFALPHAREAWARLKLRARPSSNEASLGKETGANRAPAGPGRAKEALEVDEIGRAENEGMRPGGE